MMLTTGHPPGCGGFFWFPWVSRFSPDRPPGERFLLLSYRFHSLRPNSTVVLFAGNGGLCGWSLPGTGRLFVGSPIWAEDKCRVIAFRFCQPDFRDSFFLVHVNPHFRSSPFLQYFPICFWLFSGVPLRSLTIVLLLWIWLAHFHGFVHRTYRVLRLQSSFNIPFGIWNCWFLYDISRFWILFAWYNTGTNVCLSHQRNDGLSNERIINKIKGSGTLRTQSEVRDRHDSPYWW